MAKKITDEIMEAFISTTAESIEKCTKQEWQVFSSICLMALCKLDAYIEQGIKSDKAIEGLLSDIARHEDLLKAIAEKN